MIPVYKILKLDARKLPAIIFEPINIKAERENNRSIRADKAWENFGKPGRDPRAFCGILQSFASNNNWNKQLNIAKLRNSWNEVVGENIANHCEISQVINEVLIIRAQSAVWATQLSYLLPQLKEKINNNLSDIKIREIKVIGPTTTGLGSWRR